MTPEQIAAWTLILQAMQVLMIPALWGVGRFLWKMDRRLYAIELKPGMHGREGDR